MVADSRQARLEELGLTLWQQRVRSGPPAPAAEPAEPPPSEPAAAGPPESVEMPPMTGSTPPPAPSPDVAAMDWDELAAHLAGCDHRGATRPVFGVGARDADLMIIGEAPGAEEDRRGEPFVGRAGKLLDRMLFAMGRGRTRNAYIANICKFRPPENRDPKAEEVAADRPILERQIELLSPKLIVAVGRVAAQTLLETQAPLGKLRGQVHTYPGRSLPLLVTYHPAYLLRSPQHKNRAWEDLREAMRLLDAAA
ncbi:uracil-DNA glycosylase [Spectribacter hydrogenoxidans]|uniref:Type-4 uracil-DNA glycosylase n=1 Tax=Spectribacter hydrogenoxidans TaxID=3075608 RepID=A0ABU3BY30_9GAMM|nr:uracil-DNA glycosylase [Salinisphaera sp. W335]MDT0634145.1 uracil-DNA glycosylase [Salinisphaera sp. W335]